MKSMRILLRRSSGVPSSSGPSSSGPSSRDRGRSRAVAVGVIGLALATAVASCASAEDTTDAIGYVVDGGLPTYNVNTIAGASSGAPQAFARTLGGFSFLGPEGNVVADLDFGEANRLPGDQLAIDYQINPSAKYSDGQPVVCDDLVLAWAAGSGSFTRDDDDEGSQPLFDAATMPGMADVESVDCVAGAASAVVTFLPGRTVTAWRALFSAMTVLPAHVVGAGAGGVDIVRAVQDGDETAMAAIAEFWNSGFALAPGKVDPAVFVSSGPYRLDSIGEDGSATLKANEYWWGDAPRTEQIIVWPRSVEVDQLVADGRVQVLDVRKGSKSNIDLDGGSNDGLNEGFDVTTIEANGIEQLTLGTEGVLSSSAAREALALCIPRDKWAPVVDSRLSLVGTSAYPFVAGTADGRYATADGEAAEDTIARAGLAEPTVRIGYEAPDAGRSRLVADIASACASAGITVEDASAQGFDPGALREGTVDAVLGGSAGVQGVGGALSDSTRAAVLRGDASSNVGGFEDARFDEIVDQLAVTTSATELLNLTREAEAIAWDDLPSLPLYTQSRTVVFAKGLYAGTPSASSAGAGWNMDRWIILR